MGAGFPAVLAVAGRPAVVVGGGPVGRRKAAGLAAAGAVVRVVDPAGRPPGDAAPGLIWIPEAYRPAFLDGAWLAVAAGPADVNARVVADATARGLWVCDAADPGRGSLAVPAAARVGRLTVAVDTGGASPALARRLRDRLAAGLDGAVAAWADVLADVRPEVLAAVPDPAVRRRLLDGFADWPWLEKLRAGASADDLRAQMRAEVRAAAGGR